MEKRLAGRRLAFCAMVMLVLSGCSTVSDTFAPLSDEQALAIRENCGLIPVSLIRSSESPMKRRYFRCKRETMDELEQSNDNATS
ncbi:MAG: hypothetical protein CBB65_15040 [Hyphomonadaceae bacterium TMED5]|nr:MAG: hypothetical protein CBB65_15040 [Hyphomonadaceae bacterium TMED5]